MITQPPSKAMTVLPPILGAIGSFMMIVGAGYTAMAQSNPEVSSMLSIPAGVFGALATIGSYLVSLNNQNKAQSSLPASPLNHEGEEVSTAVHLVSIATARAQQNGDFALARRLNNAIDPEIHSATDPIKVDVVKK